MKLQCMSVQKVADGTSWQYVLAGIGPDKGTTVTVTMEQSEGNDFQTGAVYEPGWEREKAVAGVHV